MDNKTGMTAKQQLQKIYEEVRPLYVQRDLTYSEIRKQLMNYGIRHLSFSELNDEERKYLKEYFKRYILPILSPQIVDNHHPFPFIPNKNPFIALELENKNKNLLGLIPVPDTIPELIFLPSEEVRFVPSVKVIYEYSNLIFDMYSPLDKIIFSITRNADISFEDEDLDMVDFRSTMKKLLKKRNRLDIVRMETEQKINGWLKEILCSKLKINEEQIFFSRTPIAMHFDSQIAAVMDHKLKNKLYYKTFQPLTPPEISATESIISQVSRRDIMLSYPYESMEPFFKNDKGSSG